MWYNVTNMNKNIIIGIAVVVLVAGGVYLFTQGQNGANNTNPPSTAPVSAPAPATVPTQTPTQTPTQPPAPAPKPVTNNVTIQNFAFNSALITVKKGDTVVWTNKDPMLHTVTGNNGGPSSPNMGTNGTYSYTFNTAGTFGYHCAVHPSMMGTVVVN